MEEEQRTSTEQSNYRSKEEIVAYQSRWLIEALGHSVASAYPNRLGIGSFLEDERNEVEIIQLNVDIQRFESCARFQHNYPATKLIWLPCKTAQKDLLATSGEDLKLWEVTDNRKVALKSTLISTSPFTAPLTSFDWNPSWHNIVGTCSIDTSCTIWDIEKGDTIVQLLAHDKEVYDIHFSKDKDVFASGGADGTIRQFDVRELSRSRVIYETEKLIPVLKLAWNRHDTNYLAALEMDKSYVTLLDVRKPLQALGRLERHTDYVNSFAWSPHSRNRLCSVGDDGSAYIWDLHNTVNSMYVPSLGCEVSDEISDVVWSDVSQPGEVVISSSDNATLLRMSQ